MKKIILLITSLFLFLPNLWSQIPAEWPDLPYSLHFEEAEFKRLEGEGSISGKIIDEEGYPLSGVRVFTWQIEYGPECKINFIGWQDGVSDAQGQYVVSGLPPGSYKVTAYHPDKAIHIEPGVKLSSGKTTRQSDITLKPPYFIEGRVLNDRKQPIPDAQVSARRKGLWRWNPGYVYTDFNGHFQLPNLVFDFYNITVKAPGYSEEKKSDVLAGTSDVYIELISGASLEGRVSDGRTGSGVEGVRVKLFRPRRWGKSTKSKSGGYFLFEDISPDVYSLWARTDELVSEIISPVELKPGESKSGVLLSLGEGARIEGRVIDKESKEPLKELSVSLMGTNFMYYESRETDSDGKFAFAGLCPGVYRLSFRLEGGVTDFSRWLKIYLSPEDKLKKVELEIPRRELLKGVLIKGRVVDGEGEPVSGAEISVRLRPLSRDRRGVGVSTSSSSREKTDENGYYTLKVANNNKVTLTVKHPEYAPLKSEELIVKGDTPEYTLNFQLEKGVSLGGEIVDEDNSPVAGAKVRASYDHRTIRKTISDSRGVYHLKNLNRGTVEIRVEKEPFVSVKKEINLEKVKETATLNFDLERGLLISGTLQDGEGNPLVGAFISASSRGFTPHIHSSAQSQAEGRFQVTGLKPGDYRLWVHTGGYPTKQLDNVKAGSQDVIIVLEKGGRIYGQVIDGKTKEPISKFWVDKEREKEEGEFYVSFSGMKENFYDPDGFFLLEDVEEGSYSLKVGAEGRAIKVVENISVVSGETTEKIVIALGEGSRLAGQLLDKNTQAPIPDVRIRLGKELDSVRTDQEGKFAFENIPPGTWSLSASGYNVTPKKVNLEAGKDIVDLKLLAEKSMTADFGFPKGFAGFVPAMAEGKLIAQVVFPRSGADEAGLKNGDEIIEIGDKPAKDYSLTDVMKLMLGEENSVLKLKVRRQRLPRPLSLEIKRKNLSESTFFKSSDKIEEL